MCGQVNWLSVGCVPSGGYTAFGQITCLPHLVQAQPPTASASKGTGQGQAKARGVGSGAQFSVSHPAAKLVKPFINDKLWAQSRLHGRPTYITHSLTQCEGRP